MLSVCLAYLLVWSTILVLAPQAFPHVRLFIPVIPLVLILGLPTLLEVPAGRWQARLRLSLACVILAAQVAFIPTQFWHIPERIPVRRAIGLETDDQLLSRSLAPYDAVRFLNGLTGPGDRIVAVGVNDVRYYVDAPMAPAHLMPLLHDLDATLDDEGVRRLRNEGYGYLLVDRRYVPGRQADCTNPFCSETHLGRYTTPLYSRKGVTLYRIDDRPVALEPPANMLTNPGFEDLEPAGLPSGWRPYGRPRVMRNPGRDRSGAVIVAATREDGLVQRVPVTAGALYRLSHFVRTEGTSQVARLQINWLDTNRRFVEAAIQTMTARREWQPGRMLATAPDRAAWADVYVSAHAGGRVWFDDFELVRLDDRAPSDDPGS